MNAPDVLGRSATGTSVDRTVVLVVAYRSASKLRLCLESIQAHLPQLPVYVWDNSGPEYNEIRLLAESIPRVVWFFSDRNIGFASAVNRLAAKAPPGSNFLLLNPDAELLSSLDLTLGALQDGRTAAVAPMLSLSSDQVSRRSLPAKISSIIGGPLTKNSRAWDVAHKQFTLLNTLCSAVGLAELFRGTFASHLYLRPPHDVNGYVSGACVAISGDAWVDIGPFDEEFFLYCEEVDWQSRAMASGWSVTLIHEVGFRHSAGGTVAGDSAASARSSDLLRAYIALLMERQNGVFSSALYLTGISMIESVKSRLRRPRVWERTTKTHFVLSINDTASASSAERVRIALELAKRSLRVTVVSLNRIGILPQQLPSSIRLVRRPWWWADIPGLAGPVALVSGNTRQEKLFSLLFRLHHSIRRLDSRTLCELLSLAPETTDKSPHAIGGS